MGQKARQLRIIHVLSEAAPFAKTGGLADVGGALPQAQARLGAEVRVFLPFYKLVREGGHALEHTGIEVPVELDGQVQGARLWKVRSEGVDYLFVDQERHFDRAQLYGEGGRDYPDNILRFGFFCRAVLETILNQGWEPDVIHCHDWQTALLPVYLASVYRNRERLRQAAVVFTIHNLAYQGLADFTLLPRLHLPPELDDPRFLEFFGRMNPMKGGLRFSDYITTVSRTYAREILTATHGCGLEGFLRQRASRIVGIRNGIDLSIWDPASDPHIPANYDPERIEPKARCVAALRREMGLDHRPEQPLIAFICRLVEQKGVDLILHALDALLRRRVQLVFLGQGNPVFEEALRKAVARYPGRMGGIVGYEEPLAHRVTAGADIFLMPSRFEPCGLNQQYALRYGAVPLVHKTGGLADTVIPATERNLKVGRATGFSFRRYTPDDLLWAIDRSLELWSDRSGWRALMRQGMSVDLSWERAARKYLSLYRHAIEGVAHGSRPSLEEPAPGRRRTRWGPGIWLDWGPPLPSRYGRDELVLMVQGPVVLYAWWEVPFASRVRADGVRDGKYDDLMLVLEDTESEKKILRKAGSDQGDTWILVEPDREYRVHLALRSADGSLRTLLSSAARRTPPALAREPLPEPRAGVSTSAGVVPASGPAGAVGIQEPELQPQETPFTPHEAVSPGSPPPGSPPPGLLPAEASAYLPPSYAGGPPIPWDVGGWEEQG